MKQVIAIVITALVFAAACKEEKKEVKNPLEVTGKVKIDTTEGAIVVGLYGNGAPATVKNFLSYVNSGFYDGLIFHRVIPGFVIQGGGFSEGMVQKQTGNAIDLEVSPELKHAAYVIAMARTGNPNSATSQFYITVAPQPQLDVNPANPQPNGYAVFGKVLEGSDIAEAISKVPTTTSGPYANIPIQPVVIKKISEVQ